MKPFVSVLIFALLLSLVLFLFIPDLDVSKQENRTDLPWQISKLDNGNIQVFDLIIGSSSLEDAVNKLGNYEKIAVFNDINDKKTLEVYFGKKQFGLLQAKIIMRLQVDIQTLDELILEHLKREAAADGAWKYILAKETALLLHPLSISGITYIPTYRGLNEEFFISRFGKAAQIIDKEEGVTQWLYPDKGLSILINTNGYEILEYGKSLM